MSDKIFIKQSTLQGIADSIRSKTGKTDLIPIPSFATEIEGITTGEAPTLQEKTATENGPVVADSGYDGLSKVTVNVPEPVLQERTIAGNGEYTPDAGYAGFSKVTVDVELASGGSGSSAVITDGSSITIIAASVTEYNENTISIGG